MEKRWAAYGRGIYGAFCFIDVVYSLGIVDKTDTVLVEAQEKMNPFYEGFNHYFKPHKKIIDDQGRLFGYVTPRDVMVVIFTAVLTGLSFYAWRLLYQFPNRYWHECEAKLKKCEAQKCEALPYKQRIETFCKEHRRASICKP